MTTYYSTFITGLRKVVETALKERIKDAKIDLLLDGLIVYRSEEALEKIKNLRFFNNTFVLLYLRKDNKVSTRNLVEKLLRSPGNLSTISKEFLKDSFRVIVSQENQIISMNKKLLENVEILFAQKLRLEVNRALPGTEIWFLTRSDGYGLVGLRLTKKPNYEKTLHKGELRPELANLMCFLVEPTPTDVVLDPFAGYGAIPIECVRGFKVKKVIAGEKDEKVFKILQEKISKLEPKIVIGKWDALKLGSLKGKSIDKIITDPPWGFYDDTNTNLGKFYKSMLEEVYVY